jgi:hypothetical protein
MKGGCVYCGGSGRSSTCMLRVRIVPDSYRWIHCTGSGKEKNVCPEWAAAVAAEEYYLKKARQARFEHGETPCVTTDQKSAIWGLTVCDVLGLRDSNRYVSLPFHFHGSDTGKCALLTNGRFFCERHNCYHTGLTALAVMAGIATCNEAGYGDRSLGYAVDFSDPKIQYELWMYAYKHGLLPKGDPIPEKAMYYYAVIKGIVHGD